MLVKFNDDKFEAGKYGSPSETVKISDTKKFGN